MFWLVCVLRRIGINLSNCSEQHVIISPVRTCAIAAVGLHAKPNNGGYNLFFFYLYSQLQTQLSDAVVSGANLSPVIKGT